MSPVQPPRLTAEELVRGLTHVLDTIGRIRGRNLDLNGVAFQLQPCQVDIMHLYIRAVASGLLPRWIDPPTPGADDNTLLLAWTTLVDVLPTLYPGEVMAIKSRARGVLDLPGGAFKVVIHDDDAPMLIDHGESIVRLMLTKHLNTLPRHGRGSSRASAAGAVLRSMTQNDVDGAVAAYKAARAASYNDLREGVRARRPGAVKTARQLFGRNRIAREIGCRSSAMVSKSPVYQTIKAELHLHDRQRGRQQRTGLGVAANRVAKDAGDQTIDAVVANETRALLRKHLRSDEAQAAIEKLDAGQMTDEQARELVDVCREQHDDAKSRRIR